MPHVCVKMYAGRPNEVKQTLADNLAKCVVETLGCPESGVSVSVVDVPKEEWKATVYEPEIMGRPDELFKKPGY